MPCAVIGSGSSADGVPATAISRATSTVCPGLSRSCRVARSSSAALPEASTLDTGSPYVLAGSVPTMRCHTVLTNSMRRSSESSRRIDDGMDASDDAGLGDLAVLFSFAGWLCGRISSSLQKRCSALHHPSTRLSPARVSSSSTYQPRPGQSGCASHIAPRDCTLVTALTHS